MNRHRPLFGIGFAFVLALALESGCSDSDSGGGTKGTESPSLFVEGCPQPGLASAKRISRPDLKMWGPDALGGQGDYLLMNEKAAFIVSRPESPDNYYYYGGILIDAVALDGCSQAGPEQYEELELLVGRLDLQNVASSVLRGFRGESAEILNDGSDGEAAVLQIVGRDDFYWLLEYELVRMAFATGSPKTLSQPMGIEIAVDYILSPGSPVLRIEVHLRNRLDQSQGIMPVVAHIFGLTTEVSFLRLASLSIAGFDLHAGIPWISAQSGQGSLAFALEDAFPTTTNISEVDALFDLGHALFPIRLSPASTANDTASVRYFMSVGPADADSAETALHEVRPEIFPGLPYGLEPIAGSVTARAGGGPIADAEVEVQVRTLEGWQTLHRLLTGGKGEFRGSIARVPLVDSTYRLVVHSRGRPDPVPFLFPVDQASDLQVEFEPGGILEYDVRDGEGRNIPAKITLWKEDGQEYRTLYARTTPGREAVVPGTYPVSVTRGYEYTTHQGSVTIPSGGTARLEARLEHMVDTTGFLSMDGHLHSSRSPDGTISVADRIVTCAAEGLEVAVSTDHEYVGSLQSGIDETGMGNWVATVTGEEVTSSVPEHINLYGLEPRFDLDARGGYVHWYGLDIAQIFAAARARGARVISLNHPGYLSLIGYDRLTGLPALGDPTLIGLPSDAQLWSWDFDVMEYMNGYQRVFLNSSQGHGNGRFEDWMSFLNLGHRKTAVGTTDSHGFDDPPGSPRTYFASSTDEPSGFREEDMVESLISGRALVSSGAFARVSINGTAGMGDVVTDMDGVVDLGVSIEAIPEIEVTHFKVFVNCDEVMDIPASDPEGIVKYEDALGLPISIDAHVVVAGFGQSELPRGLAPIGSEDVPRFTTNAIYVDADGNGKYDAPGGKPCSYQVISGAFTPSSD